MKKPKKTIDIGGRVYKIKRVKRMPKKLEEELGPCVGWECWEKKEIGLVGEYGDDGLTLFHEIGHAAADSVKAVNVIQNETFARPFFAIFYMALKDAGMIKTKI